MSGTDCRNAFGCAHRAPALEIAEVECPTFGSLLRNLWSDVDTVVHVRAGAGEFEAIHVRDGFVQGGCEAMPGFALSLSTAMRRFQVEAGQLLDHKGVERDTVSIWAYADDLYLQCRPEEWAELTALLAGALESVGLKRRADKSHALLPAGTSAEMADGLAQAHTDALPVLGTAAESRYCTAVGPSPSEECKSAACARLNAGVQLCADISELASAPLPCSRKAPAWKLLSSVANQCLAYDSAILSPEFCAPLGRALDDATLCTARSIIGDDVRDGAATQLRLGREHGGCELRSAELRSHIAYLATTVRLAPHTLVGPAGPETAATCKASAARLAEAGVHLDAHCVAHTGDLRKQSADFSVISAPLPKRQRGMWDAADRAARERLDTAARDRVDDCSGPEGGAYLVATRPELGCSLTDPEFVQYTRLRLGLDLVAPGPCQLARVTKDGARQICGAMMDANGGHCVSCKVGGAVLAAHAEGCQIIAGATQEAGYFCRREQIIPELATASCLSPVLDCDAFGLAGADRLLIDFTLRSGMAGRYKWGQRASPATSAEGDKAVRYPGAGGVSVRGAGMELLGKHGPGLTALLTELADRARAAAVQQGRAPTRLLRKWRCQLSGVCARLVGRQSTLSQACAARSWERSPEHP